MANDYNKNLFGRLTKLFRSGPVVRRRVKGMTQKTGTASTALEVFRAAHSDVYNSTLSAYGAFDRMCVSLDTKIPIPGPEKYLTMGELIERYSSGEKFIVYAYDAQKGEITPAWAHHPRSSGVRKTVRVTFDDGSHLVCTPDHPCMMRDGTFRDAGELSPGDSMIPFYRKDFQGHGYYNQHNTQNHCVVSVEPWETIETGDLTVDGYENFATDTIIVHNSRYSDFSEMEATPEIACLTGDSVINTPAGDFTILELLAAQEEMGLEQKFPVYSYDESTGSLVVGQAHNIRKTKTASVVEVELDSGEKIRCTPDHLFLTRDGRWVEAAHLSSGDSLMPFYRKNGKQKKGYNSVYTISNGWKLEHKLVAEWKLGRPLATYPHEVVHHIDFNKCNNAPQNLLVCTAKEHCEIHGREWIEQSSPERLADIANKISIANRGRPSPFKGQTGCWEHTEEAKKKISASSSRLWENSDYRALALAGLMTWLKTDEAKLLMSSRTSEINSRRWATDTAYAQKMSSIFSEHAKKLHENKEWQKNVFLRRRDEVFSSYDEKTRKEKFSRPGAQNGTWKNVSTAWILSEAVRFSSLSSFAKSWDTELFSGNRTKKQFILRRLKSAGFNGWDDFKSRYVYENHKVINVTHLSEVEDVYDMTVDVYHNFACNGVIVHNSALDIYAEETAAQGTDGRILHIHSDNRKVQELLEDLFYDTINVEFNLPMWVRNLVKYGDFFLFNDVSPEFGVLNCIPISISEIEREEGFDPSDPMAVRYRWITQGNQVLENWQVTHFRLLGNDAFLPYGSSVLEGARRIWRQLILIEDAMLVYRVIRAPERRVFYIDVGNVPPEEISNYLEQAQTSLKRNEVVDRNTGKVDLRFNPMAVDQDYFLPVRGGESGTKIDTLAGGQNTAAIEDVQYIQKKLFAALKIPKAYLGYDEETGCFTRDTRVSLLDGREVEIERLVEEHEAGKQNWVHSCDPSTGRVVPGRIVTAWKTKDVTALIEVTIDTGDVLRCTDNHPFLLRDGTYVRADQLVPGQSLMPLRKRLTRSKKFGGEDLLDGYEQIFDNSDNEWKYTHKVVSDFERGSDPNRIRRSRVVHHIDFNKRNNEPTNLLEMTWSDHRRLHSERAAETLQRPDVVAKREPNRIAALRSEKHREQKRNQMRLQHSDPDSLMSKWVLSNDLRMSVSKTISASWQRAEYRKRIQESSRRLWEKEDYRAQYMGDNHWSRKSRSEFDIAWLRNFCVEHHVTSINQWRTDSDRSIWDISPVGLRYVNNLIRREGFKGWRDFKKSVIYNHKVASIRRIELDSPVPVFDLEIENWHNFAVVPRGYNTQGDSRSEILRENFHSAHSDAVFVHNSKATLAQEDIRFSRSIQRIQKTVLAELNKLAMIHLYAHGYEGDDLMDFTLKLSNPSSIAQQQKLELISTKFDIAGKAPEGLVSRRWIRKNILELTDQEIESLKEEREDDKLEDAAVEAAGTEEAAGAEAGEAEGGEEEGEEGGGLGDLFAGDRPDGDLLVATAPRGVSGGDEDEEDEDEEPFELPSIDDPDAPVKISNRIDRTSSRLNMFGEPLKKSRKQTRGPASTGLHDFAKMTGLGNTQSTLRDPYQKNWLKNPLGVGEGRSPDASRMESDAARTISGMARSTKFIRPKILREAGSESSRGEDLELDIDLDSLGSEFDK